MQNFSPIYYAIPEKTAVYSQLESFIPSWIECISRTGSSAPRVELVVVSPDARAVGHDVRHVGLVVGRVEEVGHRTHRVDGHVLTPVGGALLPRRRGVEGVPFGTALFFGRLAQ